MKGSIGVPMTIEKVDSKKIKSKPNKVQIRKKKPTRRQKFYAQQRADFVPAGKMRRHKDKDSAESDVDSWT